jgi:GNAT superfamily N-acetyltransferase
MTAEEGVEDPGAVVSTATTADAAALGRILGDAFRDDPVGRWFAPDPATRVARLRRFFEFQAGVFSLPHGEVLRAGDAGAALWMPPGQWQAPPLLLLRSLPRMGRVFGRRTPLMLRGLSRTEHDHPRELHWYLPFVGVATAHQGRGTGAALLSPVLRRCDETGVPAYLEATSERNRALYLRYGFRDRHRIELPDGPTLWGMWREPGARPELQADAG